MTRLFKKLFFDEELVSRIKGNDIKRDHLYSQLNAGRITLKEFLAATGEAGSVSKQARTSHKGHVHAVPAF